MNWNKHRGWATALLVVGCSSRLQVDTTPPGSGGNGTGGGFGMPGPVQGGSGNGGSAGSGLGGSADAGGSEQVAMGSLAEPCVPGGTATEAAGTVAQADISDLASCDDGLSCGSDGLCAMIPDCPQASGICVLTPAVPGTSFAPPSGPFGLPESGAQALAADDSQVYWVDYGTFDALGNYQNDGKLMAFDGQSTRTLALGLPGPVSVELTSTHVYVYAIVNGVPRLGIADTDQLFRVLLAGGEPELVQNGVFPGGFAAAGDRAFWIQPEEISTMSADAGAIANHFLPLSAPFTRRLAADATDLFYESSPTPLPHQSALWRVPLVGGEPQPVAGDGPQSLGLPALADSPFALKDDSIFGFEQLDSGGVTFDQVPKSGGTPQRVRGLGGSAPNTLQIVGDEYFFDRLDFGPPLATSDQGISSVLTASLATSGPLVRLVKIPLADGFRAGGWVATASAVYWIDRGAIYSRPLSDMPGVF